MVNELLTCKEPMIGIFYATPNSPMYYASDVGLNAQYT